MAADPSSYWLDRRELEAALAGGDGDLERVRAAVGLYRGDFLDDLVVRGAPEFEEWAGREREHLRRLAVTGLARLADDAATRSDPAAGVELARRMLSLDPLSEEAHRLLMRFLAQKDDRAAALAQFETCPPRPGRGAGGRAVPGDGPAHRPHSRRRARPRPPGAWPSGGGA